MKLAVKFIKNLAMSQFKARPFVVCVEGNVGSGKTTFLNHFNKHDNVAVFAEPVDLWRNCNGHNLLVSNIVNLTLNLYFIIASFLGVNVQ